MRLIKTKFNEKGKQQEVRENWPGRHSSCLQTEYQYSRAIDTLYLKVPWWRFLSPTRLASNNETE